MDQLLGGEKQGYWESLSHLLVYLGGGRPKDECQEDCLEEFWGSRLNRLVAS